MSIDDALEAIVEETIHLYQLDIVDKFVRGEISTEDPKWNETRWLVANIPTYYRSRGDYSEPAYEPQPLEHFAKSVTKRLKQNR